MLAYALLWFPCLILIFFTTYDVTDDLTGVFLGHNRFLSITFDQNEIEIGKGAIVIAMSSKLTDFQLGLPSLNRVLRGLDLTLTLELILIVSFLKQKVCHSTRLDKRKTMAPNVLLCNHVLRSYLPKPKTRLLSHLFT